jgi:hypothetical protein
MMSSALEDEVNALDREVVDIERKNYDFMKDFAQTFAVDAGAAKVKYYKTKVHIDTTTGEGEKEKLRMLRKYLEGT